MTPLDFVRATLGGFGWPDAPYVHRSDHPSVAEVVAEQDFRRPWPSHRLCAVWERVHDIVDEVAAEATETRRHLSVMAVRLARQHRIR